MTRGSTIAYVGYSSCSFSLSLVWGHSVQFANFFMFQRSAALTQLSSNLTKLDRKYGNQGGIQTITFSVDLLKLICET